MPPFIIPKGEKPSPIIVLKDHPFFCFCCGGPTFESGLGFIVCKFCKEQFLPSIGPDGLQSVTRITEPKVDMSRVNCRVCNGMGILGGMAGQTCSTCKGTGKINRI